MATKYRLAEQARAIITGQGGSDDSRVTIQELMVAANQAFASVVRNNLFENKRWEGEMDVNGNLIFDFDDVALTLDTKKKMYYCTLPSSYISLPNDVGLHQASWQESPDAPIVIMRNGFYGMMSGLMVENMENHLYGYPENNKIYFPKITSDFADKKLSLKLVCALDGIAFDAEIALPPDIEYQIVQSIVGLYNLEQQAQKDPTNTKTA